MNEKKFDEMIARMEVLVEEFEVLFEDWMKLGPDTHRIRQKRADELFEHQLKLLEEWEAMIRKKTSGGGVKSKE